MSAGHTPGPWTVSDLYADDEGHPELSIMATVNGLVCHPAAVCLQFPRMEGMQMANARLIASAPDLLAERDRLKAANAELADTLDEFLAAFDGVIAQGGISLSVDDRSSGWVSRARAALAKHKGETA